MTVPLRPTTPVPVDAAAEATALLALVGVGVLLLVACWVWYSAALAALFRRVGSPPWKAWVPVVQEMELLERGGVPSWSVVYLVVPVVQLYGLWLRGVAAHRIGRALGRGGGTTALAVLAPPVWASVLGWGHVAVDPVRPSGRRAAVPGPPPAAPALAAWGGPSGATVVPWSTPSAVPPATPPSAEAVTASAPPPPLDDDDLDGPEQAGGAHEVPAPVGGDPVVPLPEPDVPTTLGAPLAGAPLDPTAEPDVPTTLGAPLAAAATGAPPAAPGPGLHPPAPAAPASPWAAPPATVGAGAVPPPVELPPPPPVPTPQVHPVAPAVAPAPAPAAGPAAPPTTTPASSPWAAPSLAAPAGVHGGPGTVETEGPGGPDSPDGLDADDDAGRTVLADRSRAVPWRLRLDDGRTYDVVRDVVVLGRRPVDPGGTAQAVVLSDVTRTLSKSHARLQRHGSVWWVTDLGSTNGVVVVDAGGAERMLDRGETTHLFGRFVLGDLGMVLERVEPAR